MDGHNNEIEKNRLENHFTATTCLHRPNKAVSTLGPCSETSAAIPHLNPYRNSVVKFKRNS
jgi:hypothetical protein